MSYLSKYPQNLAKNRVKCFVCGQTVDIAETVNTCFAGERICNECELQFKRQAVKGACVKRVVLPAIFPKYGAPQPQSIRLTVAESAVHPGHKKDAKKNPTLPAGFDSDHGYYSGNTWISVRIRAPQELATS